MTRAWWVGLALAVGCARRPPEFAPEQVMWPPPPETPQIEWTGHIASSRWADPPNGFERFLSRLAGQQDAAPLKKPYDVVVDRQGRVFVSDSGWGRVMMFDRERKRFQWIGEGGSGALIRPFGMATDSRGHLFVCDAGGQRVVEFGEDLTFVRAYGTADVLAKPVGVLVVEDRREVWVTDVGHHAIEVFGLDGAHLRTIGGRGTADGSFNYPTGLAMGPGGEIYVADTFNFRVQVLDSEGKYLRKWGKNCDGFGCMGRAKGIDVDAEGHVFVVDAAFNVVQVFDANGGLLMFFGGVGNGPGKMWLPAGIEVTDDARVFVVSQYNWRVNMYKVVGSLTPSEASR